MGKKLSWLQAARKELGLSQAKAAIKVGISRYYFIDIENGRRVPTVKTAKRIAEALGFDWTLFYEDGA